MTDAIAAVLSDPLWAARQSAQPVVAFASNNVPVELIFAAGCFPLQLPTAPRADYARADRYMEARFDPMTRSALEQLLAGELSLARLLVLPRSVDSWQRLYYYVCELGRSFGELLPEPFLYDVLHTPYASSAAYNLTSTQLLAAKLGAIAQPPSAAQLSGAVVSYNNLRALLERVAALRHARPCRLSGVRALELFTAAQRLAPALLEQALYAELARPPAPAPGVRVLLAGSAHDTPALHQLIADAGGQVVADYHARGDLLFGPRVRTDMPPLEALSEHSHRHSWSVRSHPLQLEPLLELAAASGAEAAVFFYYEEEEALTWDHPEQAAALRARGLPCLLLPREAYPPCAELMPRLAAFISDCQRGRTP